MDTTHEIWEFNKMKYDLVKCIQKIMSNWIIGKKTAANEKYQGIKPLFLYFEVMCLAMIAIGKINK